MAPSLKETETTIVGTTASAPANPPKQSPNETPTRPQPVALEIPVTINGAHTVAGSDKREPFSETTQTVLVFAHGAVVRVAVSLIPGQLVFLTNEKTKKEVVCQVVKCKSGGSGANYVEVQFTEASPAFWGLRMPASGTPTAPVAPASKPVVTTSPAVPAAAKPVAPAAPLVPPAPKPVATTAKTTPPVEITAPEPAKSTITPLPPSSTPAVQTPAPVAAVPLMTVPPPSPLATSALPPAVTTPAAPESPKAPAPVEVAPAASSLPAPETHLPAIPPPPLHDYAKEIQALFASSSSARSAAPATPEHKIAPTPSTPETGSPSSEQLKLEAARLQVQLSSLLFTETPAAPKVPAVPSTTVKPEAPVADVAKRAFEIAQTETLAPVAPETKSAPPARRPSPLATEDEVRIPSWLAPLSHNSEPAVAEPPAPAPEQPVVEMDRSSEAVLEPLPESFHHSEAAVFGGQLLGEAAAESGEAPAKKSKAGLWIGVAAAALLLAGGAVWYRRPDLVASVMGSSKTASTQPARTASALTPPALENKAVTTPTATPESAPASATPVPATAQPTKAAEPVTTTVVPAPGAAKTSNPTPHNATVPAPEPPKKPGLGDVRLSAPVVSRGGNAQGGEAAPSIDTHGNPGGDAFAAVPSVERNQPAAPLPVGGEVKPAQLAKSVPPIYPAIAKQQHISGNVQIDALIDESGNVAELKVISGPPMLHRSAVDAVKQWKYKPAELDGKSTSMHLTVTVQFRSQ